jgi:adenine-specific DNA-methyltransferase
MQKITALDPESHSPDLVAENIAKLKELFPELLTEGENGSSVNLDVLKSLVGDQTVTDAEEKYGLNWHGKRKARQLALTPSTGTLRPCPEDSVDWDTTQNLMIEGDNLEVLKLLQKSYAGKVKMIYIDPPYNTGRDFVYPDNFQDNISNYLALTGQVGEDGKKLSSNAESSGRYHTDWLNMMYPRLKLSSNLLGDDGVIFINIDDSEVANLREICDEIFGMENFFATLTRRAMHTVRNTSKDFNKHADFILCYAKQKSWFSASKDRYIRQIVDKTENYRLDDNDGRGLYKLDPLYARNFYTPYKHTFENGEIWEAPEGSYPRYSQESLITMEKENRIVFGSGEIKAKRYLVDVQEGQPPNTILSPEDVGFNSDGTKDLRSVLNADKVFSQPKPKRLIAFLCSLLRAPDCLVLDFFAGSGTTGHAVIAQNATENQNKRYILVQLPEPLDVDDSDQQVAVKYCDKIGKPRTIAELTKERLRRAGQKIKDENPMFSGDTGFRVFKLDSTNIREWDPNRENLAESLEASVDHLKTNRTEQDILFELLLKLGLDLCVPMEQRKIAGKIVHSIGAGVLITCLDKSIARADAEPLALGILAWLKELNTAGDSTFVFRDSAFADDVAKTNLSKILEQNGIAAKNIRSL